MNYNHGTNLWRAVVAQAVLDAQLLVDKMNRDLKKQGWTDFRYSTDMAQVEFEVRTPWFKECCFKADVYQNKIIQAIIDIKVKSKYSDMVFANVYVPPTSRALFNKRKKECSVLPLKPSTSFKRSSSYRSLTA